MSVRFIDFSSQPLGLQNMAVSFFGVCAQATSVNAMTTSKFSLIFIKMWGFFGAWDEAPHSRDLKSGVTCFGFRTPAVIPFWICSAWSGKESSHPDWSSELHVCFKPLTNGVKATVIDAEVCFFLHHWFGLKGHTGTGNFHHFQVV